MANLLILWWVRAELNCRHSDFQARPLSFTTSSNHYKFLIQQAFRFSHSFQFWSILADFGKVFSHGFSHEKNA